MVLATVIWSLVITLVISFNLWPWFFWNYLIPAFIAGNLQSWRKYIEHVGMSGNSARGATRSIVANTWCGKLMSITLLHEPLHGIHQSATRSAIRIARAGVFGRTPRNSFVREDT